MNIPGYLYVEFISLLASLHLLFRKNTPFYLKLFSPYLLLTLIVEITSWQMINNQVNSSDLIFPFSAFEFEFYLFILYHIIQTPGIKKAVLYALVIYPLLAVFNIYYLQAGVFPSFTYSLGCLLIVTICIYYFYELFHLPSSVNLLREPAFWICTGLLFFYICSLPLFGMYSLIYRATTIIMENISVILTVMNVLLYTLFTVAFLCVVRFRKPILKS
ncbi:hypothetical protein [Paraflavitalea sp. CAU 1676]|uniref:hypothetical protein n=1 Tax=Paraflavitalea sp. CAU 1676 TaxID=3032598 RepID=UPI0023DB47D3|nr:hypothetical protein [Paraflavitalea sp. CAU 1676]MDF2193608.1 hypothetical protein [Paraflavitalea sp. CAU 1676]